MKKTPMWKDTTAGFSKNHQEIDDNYDPSLPTPTLTVISHPDVSRIGDIAVLYELRAGKRISLSRDLPEFVPPRKTWGEPLGDPFLSRAPILLRAKHDGHFELSPGQSRTQIALGGKPVRENITISTREIGEGVALELANRIILLFHYSRPGLFEDGDDFGLIGHSDAVISLRREIWRVADLEVPVLLRGASGTGKELVAHAIHRAGPRAKRPFIAVNLGAIPASLAASELFGSTRGAFTGAIREQEGYFRAAQGGTLFLDEIGEAPAEVQVMLMRALETGEISPVGTQLAKRVDVRIVAATDADLEEMVRKESFKSPLLYRLAGYSIVVPPLSERKEDIGRLLIHFAKKELERIGEIHRLVTSHPKGLPWLPADLVVKFVHYPWPGNIRELRNIVRQMVIGSRGEQNLYARTTIENLLDWNGDASGGKYAMAGVPVLSRRKSRRKPSKITEAELIEAMRENRWNYKATAKALDISRSSLYTLVENCARIRTINEIGEEEIRDCYERFKGDTDAMADYLMVSSRALKRKIKGLRSA